MTKKIRNCCSAGKKSKKCVRTSDKKVFNLPRRFSRKKCTSGKSKGFTMRASCAAYKDCKKGGSAKKMKGGKFDRHRHIEKDSYEEALERPQMDFPLTDDAFYEHSSSYDLNENVPDVSINLDDSSLFSNLEDTISLNGLPEDPDETLNIPSDIDEYDEIFENPPSPIRRQRGGKSKRKRRTKRRRKHGKRYTRKKNKRTKKKTRKSTNKKKNKKTRSKKQKGGDRTDRDHKLLFAAIEGKTDVVINMLDKGADINACLAGSQATLLYTASLKGHLDLVKVLVERGADINKGDIEEEWHRGQTPLYAASANGHVNVVRFLVERGADINKATNNGKTPLYIASQ